MPQDGFQLLFFAFFRGFAVSDASFVDFRFIFSLLLANSSNVFRKNCCSLEGSLSNPTNSSMTWILFVSGYFQMQSLPWKYALFLHPLWHWSHSLARRWLFAIVRWHWRHLDRADGARSISASWGYSCHVFSAYGMVRSLMEAYRLSFRWRYEPVSSRGSNWEGSKACSSFDMLIGSNNAESWQCPAVLVTNLEMGWRTWQIHNFDGCHELDYELKKE